MIRRVIQIDEEKCNGCGACAKACHEGAIGMVNGKAKLMRDDYCDGLGDCLPACPTNAISFVEREAAAYDEKAVEENKKRLGKPVFHGCPGSMMKTFAKKPASVDTPSAKTPSQLMQWPVQIKLVPVNAPYFDGADLLVAADCTAYACGSFHSDFMTGKITVIGCPKLDATDYSEKLGEMLKEKGAEKVVISDLSRSDMAENIEDAFRYDRIVLMASSYDGGVFPVMEDFLMHLKSKNYQNRKIGLVENGSWAPTAARVMKGYVENFKNVTIAEPVVTIRSTLNEASEKALGELAEVMAKGE